MKTYCFYPTIYSKELRMKKILSMVAIAALMTTGTYAAVPAAVDGQAVINGTVQAAAIVRIGSPVDQALDPDNNHFEASDLEMGNLPLGTDTTKDFDVYVLTNTYGKVTITFDDVQPLKHETDANALATVYDFNADTTYGAVSAAGISTGDEVVVSENGGRDNDIVGKFSVKVTTTGAQRAGIYYSVLPISVVAAL